MDDYAAFYMKVKVIKQKVEIRKSSRNRSLRWGGGQKEMDGVAAFDMKVKVIKRAYMPPNCFGRPS